MVHANSLVNAKSHLDDLDEHPKKIRWGTNAG